MSNTNATIWWSVPGDLEDFTTAGAGVLQIYHGAGGISGLAALGNLFFIFQEKAYTVYQYQVGNSPLQYLMTRPIGCNFHRTIVEIDGYLYYLSDTGDIRRTNGSSDQIISEKIKPICRTILNQRNVNDYYGSYPQNIPHAVHDKYLNAYRLFYAGTSAYVDKCITYHIDKDVFTTATGTNYLSAVSPYGYENYSITVGNSDATGNTYRLYPNYSDGSKAGTIDLGWITSGNPKKQVKIFNVEIWSHAQSGVTSASDCSTTLTVSTYTDPSLNAVDDTFPATLEYNSVADNLIKTRIQTPASGDYVRLTISDSGSRANYSIDRIIIDMDTEDSPR